MTTAPSLWMYASDMLNYASSFLRWMLYARGKWFENSLFVGSTTAINMLLVFFALYFWSVNRQTHFKKTKGSSITHKGAKVQDEQEEESDEDDQEEKESPVVNRMHSNLKRQETLRHFTDMDVEPDEEEEVLQGVKERAKQHSSKRRSLMAVADRVKVFSYLGDEAQRMCMEHAEFVDVKLGEYLFDRGQFDGSLYAVLTGSVRCRFHNHIIDEEGSGDDCPYERQDGKRLLSLKCEAGDVVTPLLAMLEGLVRESKLLSNPALSREPLSDIVNEISAVATSKDTRLMRVSPKCFAAILEARPVEVYRIAQTIFARLQRVTIQTVVKTMGLHQELIAQNAQRVLDTEKEFSSAWLHIASALAITDDVTSLEKLGPLKTDAAAAAMAALGVKPDDEASMRLMVENSSFVSVSPGEALISSGEKHDYIYLLLKGRMEIGATIPVGSSSLVYHRYYEVQPGSLVGRLSCFTGEASMFTERCCDGGSTNAILLKIPRSVFEALVVSHPETLTRSLENIFCLISPIVRLIDWNSTWMHVQASETVVRRGEPCSSLFVVLNGRLRASYKQKSYGQPSHGISRRRFEEYGRGTIIGEIGSLTGSRWPCNVYAVRNTEVAKLPISVLLCIVREYPNAGVYFARMIATQVQAKTAATLSPLAGFPHEGTVALPDKATGSLLPSYGLTLATIAVVPLISDVDKSAFCSTLVSALQQIAPTKHMTKTVAREHLGEKLYRTRNAMHDIKMTRLLGDVEENYRVVVYEADFKYTWWTRQCLQQADCILLLVNADAAPEEKRVEQCLDWVYQSMKLRIELVVLRRSNGNDINVDDSDVEEEVSASSELNDWSEKRPWIAAHHRIRVPFDRHTRDFQRMCRRITGLSVGLVLGGGGARGLAHLGVIRALIEAGVTVDLVGGTSQGAYIGAVYAQHPDNFDAVMQKCRDFSRSMSSVREKLLDLTLPLTSYFDGRRFNRGIKRTFGTSRIQDTVLNFFCTSVDIQQNREMIHKKGLLWKNVRASMSLAGYLPPICENGSMLVDGGYLNALPADVMRDWGARTVVAVDVAGEKERDYYEYGTHLSGWWLLWNSLNPFAATVKVPSMTDISDSLRWVSSDQHRRNVVSIADLHLRPPINGYGTLEFDKFDEIVDVGYRFAKPLVDDWVRRNPGIVSCDDQNDDGNEAKVVEM